MTPFDPQIYHRRSIRLQGYDYSQPGAYFITLVAYHRDCIFGTVLDGEIQLTALGKITHKEWMRSISIRKEIRLYPDEFIVMPNHLHAIAWIIESENSVRAHGVRSNSEKQGASLAPRQDIFRPFQRNPRSLSSYIAGFKSSVTSRAKRELDIIRIWQRNYYDHIIRNQTELDRIWDYIDTNPLRWHEDQLHPSALENPFNQDN